MWASHRASKGWHFWGQCPGGLLDVTSPRWEGLGVARGWRKARWAVERTRRALTYSDGELAASLLTGLPSELGF